MEGRQSNSAYQEREHISVVPSQNREYTAEIMFETFNVAGLYIGVQAVLALAGAPLMPLCPIARTLCACGPRLAYTAYTACDGRISNSSDPRAVIPAAAAAASPPFSPRLLELGGVSKGQRGGSGRGP